MNKKKLTIIVCSVLAVLVVGLLVNHFFNWPIDTSDASGDISKASRFSREMESEKLTNMEELLKNDTTFKEGIVLAQVVMQTRAGQFGTLVDMSNQVAGNIPDFAEVLKEMNATLEMVNNVVNSLIKSGKDLDDALSGKECANLEQTTINASLAYTTLQKQNKLANKFIETTDKYLKTAEGSDVLKFVRDQWVDYQKMTAALEGDKDAAEAMAKKGNLLNAERTLAAVISFNPGQFVYLGNGAEILNGFGIQSSLRSVFTEEAMHSVVTAIRNSGEVVNSKQAAEDVMNSQEAMAKFNQTVISTLKSSGNTGSQNLNSNNIATLRSNNMQDLHNGELVAGKKLIANGPNGTTHDVLNMKNGSGSVVFNGYTNIADMMNNNHVNEVCEKLLGYGGGAGHSRPGIGSSTSSANLSSANRSENISSTTHQKIGSNLDMGKLCHQVGDAIRQTAIGNKATLEILNH